MYINLIVALLANLACSTHAIPLDGGYNMYEILSSRIVGGSDACREKGKHMAALVVGEAIKFLTCGASIVTERHLLTAAHCIEPNVIWGQLHPSFRAVVGSNNWTSTENNIGFTKHLNHPKWSWDTLQNDIGVLFLAKDLKLSDNVVIIRLDFDWVDGGNEAFVTGWGRTELMGPTPDNLQILHVSTISSQQCLDGIKEATEQWEDGPQHDPKREICTFHSYGHGVCHGDSGSALVLKKNKMQIGIVSWGMPCAVGAPDVFTRISFYTEWLQGVLAPRFKK